MKTLILCGGSGTRLWPLSRTLEPKQFMRIFQGESLFQQTFKRNISSSKEVIVVSNQNMTHFIRSQIPENCLNYQIVAEAVGRNTAAAIALTCFFCEPDDIILVTPSDHRIQKTKNYEKALHRGKILASEGYIVTFGIQPTKPETGFGYIEASGEDVLAFHEKPSLTKAQEYLQNKNYCWNSGMFCFKVSVLLQELKQHSVEIYNACQRLIKEKQFSRHNNQINLQEEALLQIPSLSIDYAVMEHSQKIKVVSCDLGWSDLGSFDALDEELHQVNCASNTSVNAPVYTCNAENNLVLGSQRSIALIGVHDLIIADTQDALLIVKKGQSPEVKDIVSMLKEESSPLLEHHKLVHRPWGSYEVLLDEPSYKVKRIVVKPNQKLSLQKHLHRSEHWTIVEGIAWVTNGDKTFELQANGSTYIPQETVHRIENKHSSILVFIEVQQGSSTDENDIIRLEDIYGRT